MASAAGPNAAAAAAGRLAALEARVEELESLTRELTGLVYLRLDDEARPATRPTDPPDTREAA